MGVCYCSMFCCTLLYVHSSIALILMRKRELVALLNLSSWCLVMVERLFLAVPQGCLQFVIVVFPDYTYYILFIYSVTLQSVCKSITTHLFNRPDIRPRSQEARTPPELASSFLTTTINLNSYQDTFAAHKPKPEHRKIYIWKGADINGISKTF